MTLRNSKYSRDGEGISKLPNSNFCGPDEMETPNKD